MKVRIRNTNEDPYRTVHVYPKDASVYNAIRVLQLNLKRGCTDEEILDYLRKNSKENRGMSSVKRARRRLVEHGLIKRINTGNRFIHRVIKLDWDLKFAA